MYNTYLSHVSKVEVSLGEVLPQGDVQGDLSVVVVVAQVQVLVHVVFDHEGLVAVQTAPPAVWEQQGGEGMEVLLTERSEKTLVEAQLIQEDLDRRRTWAMKSSLILFIQTSSTTSTCFMALIICWVILQN